MDGDRTDDCGPARHRLLLLSLIIIIITANTPTIVLIVLLSITLLTQAVKADGTH